MKFLKKDAIRTFLMNTGASHYVAHHDKTEPILSVAKAKEIWAAGKAIDTLAIVHNRKTNEAFICADRQFGSGVLGNSWHRHTVACSDLRFAEQELRHYEKAKFLETLDAVVNATVIDHYTELQVPDYTDNADALSTVAERSVFMLHGIPCYMEKHMVSNTKAPQFFITSLLSDESDAAYDMVCARMRKECPAAPFSVIHELAYSELIFNVRTTHGRQALFELGELIDLVRSGDYIID